MNNKQDKYKNAFDALLKKIKSFDYKNPEAYKTLFKDPRVRKVLLYTLIVIISFHVLKGCMANLNKKPVPGRPVQIGMAIKKDASLYLESFGTLTALNNVDIIAQVTGKIKEIRFVEGQHVKEGDIIIVIDPAEYKANLDKAEATVAQNMANLELKKVTFDRNQALFKDGLISQQDFDTYKADLESAAAEVQLDIAEAQLAEINLGYCYITSPVDGVAGKRQVDLGNIVQANAGPVLVNIRTINELYLDFTLSEQYLEKVRKAMSQNTLEVEIETEGESDYSHKGKLLAIDNTVDNQTGTFALRATVPNDDMSLWAGQFVTLRLLLGVTKDACLVPYQAVSVGQKGSYLFVVTKDNKADMRVLTLGERENDYIVVKEGVSPGEKVVVTGQLGLAPGVPVKDVSKTKKSVKNVKNKK